MCPVLTGTAARLWERVEDSGTSRRRSDGDNPNCSRGRAARLFNGCLVVTVLTAPHGAVSGGLRQDSQSTLRQIITFVWR
jgi:hypothetical protein